jgi:hypothetical protein
MARTNCRECGAPIAWDKRDGRWIPIAFKGADWMKVCPECYRSAGNGNGKEEAEKAPPERLDPALPDDGNPF